ncbi:MAG: nucleotidyltransferase family protein [archaeon]
MKGIKTALILAGGIGERLRPLTSEIPKPLLEVNGKTILGHQFDLLKKFGIGKAIISVGYLKEKIMERIGDGNGFGIKVEYVEENSPLGTAGPLNIARESLSGEENFLCFNADNLMNLDVKEMLSEHLENRAIATIALVKVHDPRAYGIARLEGKRIAEFVEKPARENAPSDCASSGFYILNRKALGFVEKREGRQMLEYDVFPKIAEAEGLYGFAHKGQWFDTGTIESYEKVKREWRGNK